MITAVSIGITSDKTSITGGLWGRTIRRNILWQALFHLCAWQGLVCAAAHVSQGQPLPWECFFQSKSQFGWVLTNLSCLTFIYVRLHFTCLKALIILMIVFLIHGLYLYFIYFCYFCYLLDKSLIFFSCIPFTLQLLRNIKKWSFSYWCTELLSNLDRDVITHKTLTEPKAKFEWLRHGDETQQV